MCRAPVARRPGLLRDEAPVRLPEGRGSGLGRRLVAVLIEVAERIGYREMRLDTLPSMAEARRLYRRLGFDVIEPYYDAPVAGTLFMRRRLPPPAQA